MRDTPVILILLVFVVWGVVGIITNHVTGSRTWGRMPGCRQSKAERQRITESWANKIHRQRMRRQAEREHGATRGEAI